jgi:hypothetical protein
MSKRGGVTGRYWAWRCCYDPLRQYDGLNGVVSDGAGVGVLTTTMALWIGHSDGAF